MGLLSGLPDGGNLRGEIFGSRSSLEKETTVFADCDAEHGSGVRRSIRHTGERGVGHPTVSEDLVQQRTVAAVAT